MSSLVLFILLFSLSVEACNARSLRFDVRNPIMPPHDLSKDMDVDKGSLGLLKDLKKVTKNSKLLGGENMPRLEVPKMKRKLLISVAVQGIHLDYSPRKTHPPVHNLSPVVPSPPM